MPVEWTGSHPRRGARPLRGVARTDALASVTPASFASAIRLTPLPAGSQLDAVTGAFTWAPGVGFVGSYNLVFLRTRQRARCLTPGGPDRAPSERSGHVGAQVTIDIPRAQQDVAQPFTIGGWAIDLNALNAAEGTGIAAVHVWAYPLTGGPPIFLGPATYGERARMSPPFTASGSATQGSGLPCRACHTGTTISRCLPGARQRATSHPRKSCA